MGTISRHRYLLATIEWLTCGLWLTASNDRMVDLWSVVDLHMLFDRSDLVWEFNGAQRKCVSEQRTCQTIHLPLPSTS